MPYIVRNFYHSCPGSTVAKSTCTKAFEAFLEEFNESWRLQSIQGWKWEEFDTSNSSLPLLALTCTVIMDEIPKNE